MSLFLRNKTCVVVFVCFLSSQGLSRSLLYHGHSPREFIFTCKLLYQSSNRELNRERERAECGHCACCFTGNDVRIGAKTYRIGHVIGADALHLDAPTMGIYRSLTIKSGRRCLPSLIFFGILGQSVKLEKCHLGAFKGRNGKEYRFSIKYSLSHL